MPGTCWPRSPFIVQAGWPHFPVHSSTCLRQLPALDDGLIGTSRRTRAPLFSHHERRMRWCGSWCGYLSPQVIIHAVARLLESRTEFCPITKPAQSRSRRCLDRNAHQAVLALTLKSLEEPAACDDGETLNSLAGTGLSMLRLLSVCFGSVHGTKVPGIFQRNLGRRNSPAALCDKAPAVVA